MARIITSDLSGFTPYIPPEHKPEEDHGAYARKKWSENVHIADQLANSPVVAGAAHLLQEGYKSGKKYIGEQLDEAHADELRRASEEHLGNKGEAEQSRGDAQQSDYTSTVNTSGVGLGEQSIQNERNRKELESLKAQGTVSPSVYASKSKMLDDERARIVSDMQKSPKEGQVANYDKLTGTGQYKDMPKVVPASPSWLADKDTETLAKLYRAAKATNDQVGMDAVRAEVTRRQSASETRNFAGGGGPELAAQTPGAVSGAEALVRRSFRQAESIPDDKLPEAYDKAMQTGNKALASAVEARLKRALLAGGASSSDVSGLRGPGESPPPVAPPPVNPVKEVPAHWVDALKHLDDSGLARAEENAIKHHDEEMAAAIVEEHRRRNREEIMKTATTPARPDFMRDTPNMDYNAQTGGYTHRHPEEGPNSDELRAMARLADTPEKKAEVHRLAAKAALPWTTLADLFTGAHKERFAKELDTEFPKERATKSAQELLADIQLKDAHKKLYEAQKADVEGKAGNRESKLQWEKDKEARAIKEGKYKKSAGVTINNAVKMGDMTSNEARAEQARTEKNSTDLKNANTRLETLRNISRNEPTKPGPEPDAEMDARAHADWVRDNNAYKRWEAATDAIPQAEKNADEANKKSEKHIGELEGSLAETAKKREEKAKGARSHGKPKGGTPAPDTKRKPGETLDDYKKRMEGR